MLCCITISVSTGVSTVVVQQMCQLDKEYATCKASCLLVTMIILPIT